MTPCDLDADVVLARLAHLDELMRILTDMGRPTLAGDPVARLATERILSQSVEIVVDICSHVMATQSGRAPATYREAVEGAASVGVIPPETAADLGRAVGMRNILVHEYLAVDVTLVERAAADAPELLGDFGRTVAGWLEARR
ncbi:hypothetical protein SGUI_0542 [Serinicoccus hydrothermalis]|uniref:DUF86 domain-containing protein n=1 Tax=Serinicoccus hydrothermalis TaxID=1758689 RepID=A0A1B1N947_9MICO|nr:DUF86 domain-containing protein [Serinicoccus hydrothermalis]ANS77938.1 hypothetical protein SGUI_0542 [Serinicoccus hydrothermalis]